MYNFTSGNGKRIRDAALLASFSSITFAAKNKNHKTMTAAERYESVWNKFLLTSSLRHPKVIVK